jgi:hypothetical protein
MPPLDDAIATCRAYAALAGDPALPDWYEKLASDLLTVLAQYEIACQEVTNLRQTLRSWGIPTKQRDQNDSYKQAFERGWYDVSGT